MSLPFWTLGVLVLTSVAPFALAAAYFFERWRALTIACTAAAEEQDATANELARARRALADRDIADLLLLWVACGTIGERRADRETADRLAGELAQVRAKLAALEEAASGHEEQQSAEQVSATIAVWQLAAMLQRSLFLSRAEILRLDTELRRRPSRDSVAVTPEEWAEIVEAARVQPSRRAVARAVFGNSGKHTYTKVKHVCDEERLLLRDNVADQALKELASLTPSALPCATPAPPPEATPACSVQRDLPAAESVLEAGVMA